MCGACYPLDAEISPDGELIGRTVSSMEASFWTDQLAQFIKGRRVIVKGELLAHTTSTVELVRRLGAADVFVVSTSGVGTGPLPDAESVSLDVDVTGMSMNEAIHAGNRSLRNLPLAVIERLDRFDPDGEALLLCDFLSDSPTFGGRPFLACRRPEWLRLDDKTVIDEFWDRGGIRRPPNEIVSADVQTVATSFCLLDTGTGVVLAVDATEGWTGGGEGTRPVRTVADIPSAIAGWEGRTVRVTPFMEGVPCSIHGIVFEADVVVLRPVEMLILRTTTGGLFYCGCASFWDPPAARREEMRAIARRVGRQLREEVAYRGAFTIDGVMTSDGFLPTELNPRNGAGLVTMARANDFPLQLLLDAIVGRVDLDWRPADLEAFLLDNYDHQRRGGTWRSVDKVIAHGDYPVPGGSVLIGDSPLGSFLRATVEHPAGDLFAPRAAELWAWADNEFGLGIGPLTAAQEHEPEAAQ